ncbi:MAG: glycosyl transferase [Acidobacteria bacterium]|nr:glycosyl transferase [Acidobacteriota bacterium]
MNEVMEMQEDGVMPGPGGHVLSSGAYRVLITTAGSGYSECDGKALTRWTADPVAGADGFHLLLRDLDRGSWLRAGMRPAQGAFRASFLDGRARFTRRDEGVESVVEVAVVPGRNAELRRLTLRNLTEAPLRLDVTTCLEVALNARSADQAHPAFSKLFVQTEWVEGARALLARRRPRGADEEPCWMYHWLASGPAQDLGQELSFETDRVAFLGRGRDLGSPRALDLPGALEGATGNVLDPVLALRSAIRLAPLEVRVLTFGLGYARSRDEALDVCRALAAEAPVEEAFRQAGHQARLDREACGLDPETALCATRLAVDLLAGTGYRMGRPAPGAPGTTLADSLADGSGGDAPFLVVPAASAEDKPRIERARRMGAYLARIGLPLSWVVLARQSAASRALRALAEADAGSGQRTVDLDGLRAEHGEAILACARHLLDGVAGAARRPAALYTLRRGGALPAPAHDTVQDNGLGGFSPDGQEYRLRLEPGADGQPILPPMPWSNVLANESFGFLTTERGISCTWNRNSRLHRLTPWVNDPVADPPGESLYLRDETDHTYWSPLPGPAGQGIPFAVRHGFGYTTWESAVEGLEQEVTVFAARHDPLKVVRVRVKNVGGRNRKLGLFWHAHLALAETPDQAAGRVDTLAEDGRLYAWNTAPGPFQGLVAFASASGGEGAPAFTTDRAAFLGQGGSAREPEAVACSRRLDGRAGAVEHPCFAYQLDLDLAPGETRECLFVWGEATDAEGARRLAASIPGPAEAAAVLAEVRSHWDRTLSGLRIRTPEPALDLLVNGWLPYQNLACRLWGRTAYYQSGGAFGFRDQLQDASGLLYLLPELTRSQILLHAAHQFVEGDVLHWWHPPIEEGIRTRFSDDLLWLPYVTGYYLRRTGDWDILDERAPYLTARALAPGEDEAYLAPTASGTDGDLYDHCCRSLDLCMSRVGAHGLPLMGTGDWNDGMNRVGREGRGESVWMAFFLYHILEGFLPAVLRRGDHARARRFEARMGELSAALETAGWDGAWYRRAYYDDGTPLGSAANDECQIDCLAQAWATLSRAVPEDRARQALAAMEARLVDDQARMIRLLAPAFDVCDHDPGYIKGYIPGVRENGGQYTHGALWAVKAMAEAGRLDRATELLALLSPVTHGNTPEGVATYQTEPYVVAADVYGVAPLTGRGGWTWYTGSAGWMYRVAIEDILGFGIEGGSTLTLRPSLPSAWDRAGMEYRDPRSGGTYDLALERDAALPPGHWEARLDGVLLPRESGALRVPLADGAHRVTIRIGG